MRNALANMIGRGVVKLADAAKKLQTLQVALLADELKDGLEHLEPYGFTSHPKPGAEALALFLGGDRSHGVVVVCADRRFRLRGLAEGEAALYDDLGQCVHLTRSGIVIKGAGNNVTIQDVPVVNVVGGDVIADSISLKNHDHTTSVGPPV